MTICHTMTLCPIYMTLCHNINKITLTNLLRTHYDNNIKLSK